MCGIAGFSMSPSSTVNTRALAHHLLTAIETRGTDASGYAFVKGNSAVGIHKDAIPGSQLPLGGLPRRTTTGILHTRFATQGSKHDNRNNHPVLSPTGNIALVHNGVISNDYLMRKEYGGQFDNLPAVDSSVIPALIEADGLKEGVAQLEGYAAIAYIDANQDDTDMLHLARLDYSPVHFTWLVDGSFVFASTYALLAAALYCAGLDHGHIFELPEETYFRVKGGVVMEMREEIEMQEDDYSRYKWGAATAGGHGAATTVTTGRTVGSEYTGLGSSFGTKAMWDDDELSPAEEAKLEEWDKDYRSQKSLTTNPNEIAMAYAPETNTREVWLPNEKGELEFAYTETVEGPPIGLQGFYLTTEDGDLEFFASIEDLENRLDWFCNMSIHEKSPFPNIEHKLKWTNHIMDMGHITEANGFESWLEDLAQIDAFESRAVRNLEFVRDGLSSIMQYNTM